VFVDVVIGLAVALVLAWLALVGVLAAVRPRAGLLREAARIVPDLLLLIRRLAADDSLPRGVRIRLGLVLVYLASPIDLVPDFLPLIGYADDAIIVAAVLRSVVRRAGLGAVERQWPGTPDGLAAVTRLAGLSRRPAQGSSGSSD
jgi:uncharacterized membrane protein YkvA (DUF1232 family)